MMLQYNKEIEELEKEKAHDEEVALDSKPRQKDITRYEMTWKNINRSRCVNNITTEKSQ